MKAARISHYYYLLKQELEKNLILQN